MPKRLLFTLALTEGVANSLAAADPVTFWNTVAGQAFTPTQGANPVGQSRTYAILHASIHDALNAINARYASYTPGLPLDPGASPAAAVAAASRSVLTTLIPDQADFIRTAYARELAAIVDGPAKARGIALGEAAAQSILRRRQQDGADRSADPVFFPHTGPGEYQFTAPFNFAAFPGWGRVTPFAIVLKDHELDGPLPVSSARYTRDFQFVKEIGRVDAGRAQQSSPRSPSSGMKILHSRGTASPIRSSEAEAWICGKRHEHSRWSTSPWPTPTSPDSRRSTNSGSGVRLPRSRMP